MKKILLIVFSIYKLKNQKIFWSEGLAFLENKVNIKKMIIPMESIKTPKRIIKKQLKNVNKAIVEIAEMKFVNIEEKEEKLDALVFLKNQILRKAEKLEIK